MCLRRQEKCKVWGRDGSWAAAKLDPIIGDDGDDGDGDAGGDGGGDNEDSEHGEDGDGEDHKDDANTSVNCSFQSAGNPLSTIRTPVGLALQNPSKTPPILPKQCGLPLLHTKALLKMWRDTNPRRVQVQLTNLHRFILIWCEAMLHHCKAFDDFINLIWNAARDTWKNFRKFLWTFNLFQSLICGSFKCWGCLFPTPKGCPSIFQTLRFRRERIRLHLHRKGRKCASKTGMKSIWTNYYCSFDDFYIFLPFSHFHNTSTVELRPPSHGVC